MPDLREQLQQLLQGRVCLMGLGNVDYGDDGFGVRLAERLKSEVRSPKSEVQPSFGLRSNVIVAGPTPERFLGQVADDGFEHLVFLDAVEFGGAPGSVILLNTEEMAARFPQISTHRLSLGLLARQVEANGRTKAWLLGAQPESLKPGGELTPTIRATLELLLDLLRDVSQVGRAVPCVPRTCRPLDSATSPARRGLLALPEVPGLEVLA